MTRAPIAIAVSFLFLLLGAIPATPVSNVCVSGTCDITDPIFVNVYWDSSVSQWDTDIAATDPSATVLRLDAITAAICHSNYFAQLRQYGINSCSVAPSIVEAGCGPIPNDLNQAHDQLGAFASCVVANHPEFDTARIILNVLIPPQVVPKPITVDVLGETFTVNLWCTDSNHTNGEHDKYSSPVAVTFIPTNSLCNQSQSVTGVRSITGVMTHEMVEATTDPVPASPSGWKVLADGEVADQCENLQPRANQFLYGLVALYFDDNANGCTTSGVGNPPGAAPTADTATVTACGSGKHMRITVTGTTIEPVPWDVVNSGNGGLKTMFLQGAVGSKFNAGGFWNFPPDSVGFGPISWTSNFPDLGPTCAGKCSLGEQTCMNGAHSWSDRKQCIAEKKTCTAACPAPPPPVSNQIVIHGFDNNYGAGGKTVAPGDTITVTVTGWTFGDVTLGSITVPGPDKLLNPAVSETFSTSSPWIFVGDYTTVSGKFVDAGGCAVGGVDVQVSASDADPNAIAPSKPTTKDDGTFSAQYTPSGPAGTHTVNIAAAAIKKSVAVPVHPVATSLSQSMGLAAGGQALTLSGDGFDSAAGATRILFEGPKVPVLASVVNVADVHTVNLTTPASPLGPQNSGWVQVVAAVNGLPSQSLPYLFFVPDQPILSFNVACVQGLHFASFTVDAYDVNGKPASEQITLSAPFKAFMSGGQAVASLTVPAGANVLLNSPPPYPGPFTAVPSANPKLAVTEWFPANAPTGECKDPTLKYSWENVFYFPGPDPIESVSVDPAVAGQSVIWAKTAPGEAAPAFIAVTGASQADRNVQVRILGARDLAAAASARAFGFARERSGRTHVRLLGPTFSVAAPPAAAAVTTSKAFSQPALMSFRLPDGVDASQYAILHSAPNAQSWTEVASVPFSRYTQRFVHATISDSGTYALRRLETMGR